MLAFLACLYAPQKGYADDVDAQIWAPVTLEFPVSDRLQGFFRAQPRWDEYGGGWNRIVLQPAVAYPLTEKSSIWAGYMYANRNQPGTRWEHRLWQQFMTKQDLPANFELQHRARIEQRFMNNAEHMGWRGRYRLLLYKNIGDSPYYVFTGDELLLNFNDMDRIDDRAVIQNRVHLGVGRNIKKNSRVELGYMFVISDLDAPIADRVRHVAFINLWIHMGSQTLYDVRDKGL